MSDATFKYTRSIELMHAVDAGPRLDLSATPKVQKEMVADCTRLWDELYDFVHANFPRPESADVRYHDETFVLTDATKQDIQDVYELLREHKQDEVKDRLMALPPGYRDVIFPVAIARYLLCYCDVPLNAFLSTTFTEFHHRYGYIVINGASLK